MRIRIAWCPLLLAACGEASATGDTTGDVASTSTDASTSAAPGTSSFTDADESSASMGTTQDASSGVASDTSSGTDTGVVDEACRPPEPPLDPPAAEWEPVAADLSAAAMDCQHIAGLAAQPCSARVVIGIENGGIWASDDAGASWAALGEGSQPIDHRPMSILFDPHEPTTMWSAGIYGSAGVFTSVDDGATFTTLGTMTFSQLVAVDFGDPQRSAMVVGTHGQPRQVYLSTDHGGTWTNIGENLAADSHNSESPVVIDASTYLVGACGYGDGVCGIHRTQDAGATWTRTSDLSTSHFGGPLRASDGSIYWPLLGEAGLAKSSDDGETFTQITTGTVLGVTPLELPDGSLATLGSTAVLRSIDEGVSWQPTTAEFPAIQSSLDTALTYSTGAQAFFVVRRDCGTDVAHAIQRVGYALP